MAGLVPGPVSRGFRRGLDTGSLSGSVLVFDISGFTPLTEELSRMGHHGAEELAEILQRVFSPGVLRLIRSAGGFVSGFSGDSFTVIFPGTEFLESLKTADKILNKLRASSADHCGASSIYHCGASSAGTGSGRFPPLEFKAGAASGDIRWHILGRDSRGWLFSGPAVSSASAAVNGASSMEVCRGLADPVTGSDTRAPVIRSSRKTEAAFFPPVILSAARSGEFRRVFSVFVSLGTEEDEKRLRDRAALMMDHCFEAGGYWNGVHHDAAGPYALALFGAPWSYENDGTRSLVFSRRLMEEFGEELHIGVDAGTVYAGMVGFNRRATYTVLGNSVNTASRIMRCSSRPGIRISGAVHERVSGNTFGAELLEIPLKGRSGLTEVYSIQPEYFSETGGRFQQVYVGRLREKGRFRRTSMKVLAAGKPMTVVVSGRAGTGKSHFIHEAGNTALQDGFERVTLQCSDISRLSFQPFIPFIREIIGLKAGEADTASLYEKRWSSLIHGLRKEGADPAALKELTRTGFMLGALLGFIGDDSLYHGIDARARRENTIAALLSLFTALASVRPLMLVIEDFQWMDGASAELVTRLSSLNSRVPLLLVLSCRLRDDGSMPPLPLGEEPVEEISMGPMAEDELARLHSILLDGPAGEDLKAFLNRRTAGNPLFVQEYVRYLRETGCLAERNGSWTLSVRPEKIPLGIGDLLQARLDRLSGTLRETVLTASVLGYEFNTRVLALVMRKGSIRVQLDSGADYSIWSSLGDMMYIFSHALLRDAAYAMQLLSHLRRLHLRAAEALLKLSPDDRSVFSRVAYHYEMAGEGIPAVRYLKLAAEFATENYYLEECLDYQERLWAIVQDSDEFSDRKRLEALLERISTLNFLNRWDEAITLSEKAEKIAVQLKDDGGRADVLLSRAWMVMRLGRMEETRELIRRGEELSQGAGHKPGIVRALSIRGAMSFNTGDYALAEECFLEKMRLLKGQEESAEYLKSLANLGCIYKDTGNVEKADDTLGRAALMAERTKRLDLLCIVLGNRGTLFRNMGRYSEAIEDYQKGIELATRIGDRRGVSTLLGGLALVRHDQGDIAEARDLYLRQLEISLQLDYKFGIAEAHGYLASCLEALGDMEGAEENYERCIEISEDIGLRYYIGIFMVQKARLLLKQNRLEECLKVNERGMTVCEDIGMDEMLQTGKTVKACADLRRTRDPAILTYMYSLAEEQETANMKAFILHNLWGEMVNLKDRGQLTEAGKEDRDIIDAAEKALGASEQALAEHHCRVNREMVDELKVYLKEGKR